MALPDGYRLRPARPSDAVTIAHYHHHCWVEAFTPLLEPGVVAQMDPEGKLPRFRRWLSPGSGFTTVVAVTVADDRAVAHVSVEHHEVVHLFVDPDHWGRGLGRVLLGSGERVIVDAGHDRAELHTMVGNVGALALYRSAGWTVTDRIVHNDQGGGVVYDEHVLVKDLTP